MKNNDEYEFEFIAPELVFTISFGFYFNVSKRILVLILSRNIETELIFLRADGSDFGSSWLYDEKVNKIKKVKKITFIKFI